MYLLQRFRTSLISTSTVLQKHDRTSLALQVLILDDVKFSGSRVYIVHVITWIFFFFTAVKNLQWRSIFSDSQFSATVNFPRSIFSRSILMDPKMCMIPLGTQHSQIILVSLATGIPCSENGYRVIRMHNGCTNSFHQSLRSKRRKPERALTLCALEFTVVCRKTLMSGRKKEKILVII